MTTADSFQRLFNSDREDDRLEAVRLIAKAGAEASLAELYRAMGDDSWRVRKEATEVFLQIRHAASLAGEIIELLHAQDNAGLRNTAAEILIRFGREAVQPLLEELGCADHDVRKFVLDILGEIGDDQTIPAILGRLTDPDTNVRAAAAENLGKLRASEAVEPLLEAMVEADLMFRFTILEALAQIGAEIPVERLLAYQNEKLLRKALFDCLGHIGNVTALSPLVDGLHDEMRNVREAAAVALWRLSGKLGGTLEQTLAALHDQPSVAQIVDMVASRDNVVRQAGVFLLGMIGDVSSVEALLGLLEDQVLAQQTATSLVAIGQRSPGVLMALWEPADTGRQICLAYLFGESRCTESVDLLRAGLGADDPLLRQAAAQSLGLLGDPVALPELVGTLEDEDEAVSEALVLALGRLGDVAPAAVYDALMPLLAREDARLRTSAVRILGRLAGEEVARALEFALKDESSAVRGAAIRSLQGRQDQGFLPALMLALTDEDVEVRRLATEILGESRNCDCLEALALALQDDDIWVRSAAVRSLGRLDDAAALAHVWRALTDPVGLVVIAALETICDCQPENARDALVPALGHADEEVVNSALQLLLSRADMTWIADQGDELLNHQNWEVRLATARAISQLVGPPSITQLEARLLVEGEDLVRQELQDLIVDLKLVQG